MAHKHTGPAPYSSQTQRRISPHHGLWPETVEQSQTQFLQELHMLQFAFTFLLHDEKSGLDCGKHIEYIKFKES